jgi:hypothetical protein
MGGSSSKSIVEAPVESITAPVADISRYATVSLEQAQRAAQEAQSQAQSLIESTSQKAAEQVAAATATASQATSYAWWMKIAAYSAITAAVVFGVVLLYDYIAVSFPSLNLPVIPGLTQVVTRIQQDLSIIKATHGNTDVTSTAINKISNGTLSIPASLSNSLGGSLNPGDKFSIIYQYAGDPASYSYTVDDTTDITITPSSKPGTSATASSGPKAPPPSGVSSGTPLISRILNSVSGNGTSTGDLVPRLHDATTAGTIQANQVPLSNQTQGAYSMQWWMFIKDWNYGYGKQKGVVKRTDATNPNVTNPMVTLHPTDNTLQVTVSLFGSDGSTGSTTPAPATGSGASTDDVYTCQVENIPLQTWFSVGVSVFGRNLDVYIDGKLVKSCLLPGVPKPAAGDITLASGGGFSGYICNFYHYARMLTPGDAMTFFSSGTSCKNATGTTGGGSATGYSVKFGVYDTLGKQVQEYSF